METKNVNTGEISTGSGNVEIGDKNFYSTYIINNNSNTGKYKNLIDQTKNVLDKISDNICGIKLERDFSKIPIKDLFNYHQFVFINGVAGSGKSVYAKHILEQLTETCIISFSADQFLKSSLITALHEYNIDNGLNDVFNNFSEYPNKLIYIDSFEKLLEGDGEAFRELMTFLNTNKEIKILLSCRDYALDTLLFNFFYELKVYKINVPVLSGSEFDFFKNKITSLQKISTNDNLKDILRVPKYLSLAVKLLSLSTANYTTVNIIDFKKALWKNIVEGTNEIDAINLERGRIFINITLKRAKKLTILTSVNEFNSKAVKELFNEGVLFRENDLYAPSHDIFEDWGLIKYLDSYYIENRDLELFYNGLGNEPAIRRAFRLWIESKLEESESWINNFILESITNSEIENNWKDEVITAITKSEYCDKYFSENDKQLIENNFTLLNKFVHLLKISGKNSEQVPNNKGWDTVIKFIYQNIATLKDHNSFILEFLFEWENILYFTKIDNALTPKYVGEIVYKILCEDKEFDSNSYNNDSSLYHKSIKLLYQLTEYIPDKIMIILDAISKPNAIKLDFRKGNHVKEKIDYALSHFYSGKLISIFPDKVVEIANQNWRDKRDVDEDEFFYRGNNEIEYSFGLTSKHIQKYYPESSYQTFVYKFLNSNPIKALDFIIDFTNYTATHYFESSFLKEDRVFIQRDVLEEIQLLYNGSEYTMYGSNYLWSINRGGQVVVPDLLQSIVIALERYLYETGKMEGSNLDTVINTHIQRFFDEIYRRSNSVILLSVLSSIAMAYPKRIGNKFLPLLSSKYFFEWDRSRWLHDSHKANYMLRGHHTSVVSKLANEERIEALNWEHRTKYYKGLEGFIVDYQFNIRELNEEVHKYLDLLKEKVNDDISDKKLITEIDARNWKDIRKWKEENGNTIIQIQPDYSNDEELSKQMQDSEQLVQKKNQHSTYHLWVTNIFQKKSTDNFNYDYWKTTQQYINKNDQAEELIDVINPFPVGTLAVIGVTNFKAKLKAKEFKWCINTILDIAKRLYQRKDNRFDYENMDFSISIYDNDAIYGILPFLYQFETELTRKQYQEIKALIFLYLRDLNSQMDTDIKHLYTRYKNELWDIDCKFASSCFGGLINYAKFNKRFPKHKQLSEREIMALRSEEGEILNQIEQNTFSINFNEINYNDYSHWDLQKAIEIFPTNKIFSFSYEFLEALLTEQLVSYTYERNNYNSVEYYEIGNKIKNILAEFLLENEVTENSKKLFSKIIEFEKKEDLYYKSYGGVDDFLFNCIQEFYCYVDSNQKEKVLTNFWIYWNILFENIKDRNNLHFNKEFLFYLGFWKQEANDCYMLKTNSFHFVQQISVLTKIDIEALLQLLSGIGFEKLVPQGIRPLVKQMKENSLIIKGNSYYYAEKLMMRCFNHRMKAIKESGLYITDFFFLLDTMINLGSSKAYYIRENIILYKKPSFSS